MRKKIANCIMVLAMLAIICSGVMIVGNVKGWFVKPAKERLLVNEQSGNASIERKGIVYALNKGTILQKKDYLETMASSITVLKMPGIEIAMNENTGIHILSCNEQEMRLLLKKGEMIVTNESLKKKLTIELAENCIEWNQENTICAVQFQDGSQTVSVLSGEIKAVSGDEVMEVSEGQSLINLLQKEGSWKTSIDKLNIRGLDDFVLNQALSMQKKNQFCMADNDIEQIIEQRKQEQTKANEELLKLNKKTKKIKVKKQSNKDKKTEPSEKITKEQKVQPKETGKPVTRNIKKKTERKKTKTVPKDKSERKKTSESKKDSKHKSEKNDSSEGEEEEEPSHSTEEPAPTKEKEAEKKVYSCTISINCSTILNNMEHLKQGKSGYVPASGCILSTTEVEFTDGETVYDVLKRTCDTLHIQMEASYTPIYKSYYVEGIHNLYEFDCGSQSGWMYKVNGWYPNYGCSSYKLKDGDAITWNYTCEGLGEDVS